LLGLQGDFYVAAFQNGHAAGQLVEDLGLLASVSRWCKLQTYLGQLRTIGYDDLEPRRLPIAGAQAITHRFFD